MRNLLTFAFFLLFGVGLSAQKIYRVNTTDDVDDGQCNNTHCSLREAINDANTDGISSILWFELNGAGLKAINLTSALPAITEGDLTIDGNTLADNLPTAGRLIIDGQTTIENCFDIQATNIRIYGLQVQNFIGSAIYTRNASIDTLRNIKIGKRKQGNIFLNNGYGVNAENVTDFVFQANYVGTNMNFDRGRGNRNGIFIRNDWESSDGASIIIGGSIEDLEGNYFVNCSETALNMSYQGAGIIEGNVFGTDASGTEDLGNNIGIRIANLHGRIDIGGSPDTKNIFAHNDEAIIVDRNNFVRVSENSFYCNGLGLSIVENAHPTPLVDLVELAVIAGQAQPNDFVELYITDAATCNSEDCQGMTYLGVTRTNADGVWEFEGDFKFGQQMVALSRNNGRQSMFSECFTLCPAFIKSEVTNNGPYCANDDIELSLETSFTGYPWVAAFSSANITHEWIGPNGYNSNEQNPQSALQSGQYIGQAYLFGCPSIPDTTEVFITNLSVEIEAGNSFCRADSFALNSKVTTNASQVNYRWTGPNNYTSVFKNPVDAKDSGQYNVMITGNGCQSEVASINVDNHFPEPYSLGISSNVCEGERIDLTLPAFNNYQWSGDFDLVCDTCQSISLTPTESGTLSVNLGPTTTCFATASLAIEVVDAVTNTEERILCAGSSLNLLAQTITAPGTYSAKYTGSNGCDSTQTFIVIESEPNNVFETRAICEGEVIEQFGQIYASSGVYQASFTGANGCDSIHTLDLTVLEQSYTEASFAICAGESMSIFGTDLSETATVSQTFTGVNGCDSIHTVHLLVNEAFEETEQIVLCAGENTTLFSDMVVSESGVFERSFVSSLGCDSVVQVEVEVLDPIFSVNEITLCDKEALALFGDASAIPGDYEEILTTQSGCDSTIFVSYNIIASQETEAFITICNSEEFLIDGNVISESGRYESMYTATDGCDSMHITNVTILPINNSFATYEICAGEALDVFGEMVNTEGTFSENFTTNNGCDSLHTVTVFVKESQATTEAITICEGESITLFDQLITTEEEVSRTFSGANGCDSLHTISVYVTESQATTEAITICEGESITLFDQLITADDQVSRTFSGSNGCDSTHSIQVNVLQKVFSESSESLCQANCISLYGATACATNSFQETLTATSGCDSIHTVNLTITQPEEIFAEHTLCLGDSLAALGGFIKEAGVFSETFTTANGCDSIHTVNLTFTEPTEVMAEFTLCPGDSVAALGGFIKEAGIFSETFMGSNGCDSIHTVNLIFTQSTEIFAEHILCPGDSLAALGSFIKEAGTFSETYTGSNGCDSIHTVNLTFSEQTEVMDEYVLCPGDSIAAFGGFIKEAGTFSETFTGSNGCDSIHMVNLTFSEQTEIFAEHTLCPGDSLAAFGGFIKEAGIFSESFTGSNGCDSIHTINLTFSEQTEVMDEFILCPGDSVAALGGFIKEAGTFSETFTGSNGCDSIHTVNLIFTQSTEVFAEHILCPGDSIAALGGFIKEAGTFSETFTGSSGCDSIHTVNLVFTESTEVFAEHVLCQGDSLAIFGGFIKEAGIFSETYTASNGCDSIHMVSLTFSDQTEVFDEYILCPGDSVAAFGGFIKEAGTFSETFTASSGCDSIHTVNLVFTQSTEVLAEHVLCLGDSLAAFGGFIKEAGTFSETFTGSNGCDSIHTVNLTFSDQTEVIDEFILCPGDSIAAFGGFIKEAGTFSETFTASSGCDSIHTVNLVFTESTEVLAEHTLCLGDSLAAFGGFIKEAGIFSETFTGSNGCDSIHTVNLTFSDQTEVIDEYILCPGDSIAAFGGFIKEAGTFSETFTASSGCDSIHTVNLIITQPTEVFAEHMLCAGDSIAAFGGFIKEAGTFSNTFTGANGCDSVHTINLVFTEMIETVSEQMLCEGDSIAVLGSFVKEEGAFSRTFSSASGCDSMHTVIVNFNEPITAHITTSLSCPENANGGLELLIAGGTGPYQVEWNGNDVGNTTNVNNLSAGVYEVVVMDSLGCRRTENVLIEAAQKPSIDADILDVSCFGQADGSITLFSEVAGVAFSLDGTNFETATSFSDLRPSAYEISIKDELGCIFTEIYEIAEPLQTTVSLPEMTTINLGASIILEPSISTANQVSYEWTEIESLSCSDCENPIAAPLKDTKYTVTIYDENNCESQADTWVIVEANQNLYVPNVFSPNGDGQNDIFLIQSAEGPIDEIEFFKIYDRWGNLLYEANNFSPNDEAFGWNGQFKGQAMDNGVYIFVANVKFKDGTATQVQGDITLVK